MCDAAVHFRANLLPPEMHESGLTRTAAEAARYSSKKAQMAVDMLAETLAAVRNHLTPTASRWAVDQQWFIAS